MDSQNPYQPPAADPAADASAQPTSGGFTPLMVRHLSETKPWVRLLSILLFVSAGLMALAGGGSALVMAIGAAVSEGEGFFELFAGIALGVIYFVMAVLYIPPALYLHRYAGSIEIVKGGGGAKAIETALGHQRSFWRFVGILTLIGMAVGVLGVLAALIIPAVVAISSLG